MNDLEYKKELYNTMINEKNKLFELSLVDTSIPCYRTVSPTRSSFLSKHWTRVAIQKHAYLSSLSLYENFN